MSDPSKSDREQSPPATVQEHDDSDANNSPETAVQDVEVHDALSQTALHHHTTILEAKAEETKAREAKTKSARELA